MISVILTSVLNTTYFPHWFPLRHSFLHVVVWGRCITFTWWQSTHPQCHCFSSVSSDWNDKSSKSWLLWSWNQQNVAWKMTINHQNCWWLICFQVIIAALVWNDRYLQKQKVFLMELQDYYPVLTKYWTCKDKGWHQIWWIWCLCGGWLVWWDNLLQTLQRVIKKKS